MAEDEFHYSIYTQNATNCKPRFKWAVDLASNEN